jgi:hypothetical protein
MRNILVLLALALGITAFAQEEYQETDYNIPLSEDEQIDRGIAGNVDTQAMDSEPRNPEDVEPSYDYSGD